MSIVKFIGNIGMLAEEIYRIARQNMKQKMLELLMPMQKVLKEMAGISVGESGMHLYVLTNKERVFGASAMRYSEEIKGLADKLHTDLQSYQPLIMSSFWILKIACRMNVRQRKRQTILLRGIRQILNSRGLK